MTRTRPVVTKCIYAFLRVLCDFVVKSLLFVASNDSSFFFIPSPPENPPSVPAELITRCQGMIIGIGFAPTACPTALAASGFLILRATQAYDRVSPEGIFITARQTACWKGE